jgi:hypothetical protein
MSKTTISTQDFSLLILYTASKWLYQNVILNLTYCTVRVSIVLFADHSSVSVYMCYLSVIIISASFHSKGP